MSILYNTDISTNIQETNEESKMLLRFQEEESLEQPHGRNAKSTNSQEYIDIANR